MRQTPSKDFEAFRAMRNSIRVRLASTANVTIATGLNAGDSIDGVTLAAGDFVLLKDQSTTAENGVYIAGVVPVRHYDFGSVERSLTAAYDTLPGLLVTVMEGTVNADTVWLCTSNKGGTLETTAIAFAIVANAGWQTYTPTVTSTAGTLTTVTAVGRYITINKITWFGIQVTLTDIGTATGRLRVTLPSTAANTSGQYFVNPSAELATLIVGTSWIASAGTYVEIFGTATFIVNGNVVACSGLYQNA